MYSKGLTWQPWDAQILHIPKKMAHTWLLGDDLYALGIACLIRVSFMPGAFSHREFMLTR